MVRRDRGSGQRYNPTDHHYLSFIWKQRKITETAIFKRNRRLTSCLTRVLILAGLAISRKVNHGLMGGYVDKGLEHGDAHRPILTVTIWVPGLRLLHRS